MFHSFILQAHLVGLKLHVDLAQFEGMRGVDGRVARRGDAPQHAVDILVPLAVAGAGLALVAGDGVFLHLNLVHLHVVDPIVCRRGSLPLQDTLGWHPFEPRRIYRHCDTKRQKYRYQ